MTLREFIRRNRSELDAYIKSLCKSITSLNDKDREDWIYNEAPLYEWTRKNVRNL